MNKIPLTLEEQSILAMLPLGSATGTPQRVALRDRVVNGLALAGAILRDCSFVNVRFENLDLSKSKIAESEFVDCEFVICEARECEFQKVTWTRCVATSCHLLKSKLVSVLLSDCELDEVRIEKSSLTDISAINLKSRQTRLADCNTRVLKIEASNLQSTDATGDRMAELYVRGSIVSGGVLSHMSVEELTVEGGSLEASGLTSCTVTDLSISGAKLKRITLTSVQGVNFSLTNVPACEQFTFIQSSIENLSIQKTPRIGQFFVIKSVIEKWSADSLAIVTLLLDRETRLARLRFSRVKLTGGVLRDSRIDGWVLENSEINGPWKYENLHVSGLQLLQLNRGNQFSSEALNVTQINGDPLP